CYRHNRDLHSFPTRRSSDLTHGMENLCDRSTFTGFTRDGGYATHVFADSRFCLAVPGKFGDAEAAPLLCAGLIGYRALKLAGEGDRKSTRLNSSHVAISYAV